MLKTGSTFFPEFVGKFKRPEERNDSFRVHVMKTILVTVIIFILKCYTLILYFTLKFSITIEDVLIEEIILIFFIKKSSKYRNTHTQTQALKKQQ